VDGRPAEILRANLAFRALEVTPGPHTVDLVYRPPAVLWGLSCSALTLAALGAARLASARRTRRGAGVEYAAAERYDLRPPAPDSP